MDLPWLTDRSEVCKLPPVIFFENLRELNLHSERVVGCRLTGASELDFHFETGSRLQVQLLCLITDTGLGFHLKAGSRLQAGRDPSDRSLHLKTGGMLQAGYWVCSLI